MTATPLAKLNTSLDGLVRPQIRLLRRPLSSFQVCGYTGLVLAVLLGAMLATHRGLSLWVLAALALAAMGTFLTLAMITKIIVGKEFLIYYHHEVAILATSALLLWLLDQPVLAFLDIAVLGIGMFLACGRLGCFLVGCCHGLPHRWGVRYRREHAEAGFTPYFVGVRLFPVQLVEAAWVFASVAVGVFFVLSGRPPGEALAWYVITYDIGRFCLEFLRGDPDRPYRLGFSEGQWTSLLLMVVVVGVELRGAIPFHPWHLFATVGVAVAMIAVAVHRRFRQSARHRLLHPHHVRELAGVLEQVQPSTLAEANGTNGRRSLAVEVGCTSAGIQLSRGMVERGTGRLDHYTLSARDGRLEETDARALAGLILQLTHRVGGPDFIAGRRGVFHLLASDLPSRKPPESHGEPQFE